MTYEAKQLTIGINGVEPGLLLINTNSTVAEVLTAGYLGPAFVISGILQRVA